MNYQSKSRRISRLYSLVAVLSLSLASAYGQTFRGGISGVVTDQSGAAIPNATVVATDDGTGTKHETVSSSAGEFAFQEIPMGSYTVTTTASGFQVEKIDKVPVDSWAHLFVADQVECCPGCGNG